MQSTALLVVSILAAVHALPAGETSSYTTRFDNVDVEQILSSNRLLRGYMNCLLDKGPCTPDGAELKKVIPDALESECSKCSPAQKTATEKVFRFLLEQRLEQFNELQAKYDPRGEYRRKYEAAAREKGITIAPSSA